MTSEKKNQLIEILENLQSTIVCFSGGMDSTVLLTLAAQVLGKACTALTATGPWTPPWELEAAKRTSDKLQESYGIKHVWISSQLMENPLFVRNDENRCYYCKQSLFATAHKVQTDNPIAAIVDGTHMDDLGEHRPGLMAARQAGIRHIFVEARFTKSEIEQLANGLGIEISDRVGSCCFATRIPHGTGVTVGRLKQVAEFETALRAQGYHRFRVRHHERIARIEFGPKELSELFSEAGKDRIGGIVKAGIKAGFQYVTVDLQGYRRSL